MRFKFAIGCLSVWAALATGCAGAPQGSPAVPSSTNTQSVSAPLSRAAAAAHAPYTYLYVTDPRVGKLQVLDPSYDVVETITNGLSDPVGDFVDAKGDLYVANENNCSGGNVVEYAPGGTSPRFTYTNGLVCPLYVGADSGGHVFVFDYGNGNKLVEFPQGKNKPIKSWSTCNSGYYAFCYPTGLAVGPSSTVFLTMYGAIHGSLSYNWVVDEVFDKLSNTQLYVTGYVGPAGGCVLDKNRNILVGANPVPKGGGARPATGTWGIVKTKYPYGGSDNTPVNLHYVGLSFVSELALSADQKTLYVADYGGSTLTVLTYPKGNFVTSLGSANGLTDPDGVALGPAP